MAAGAWGGLVLAWSMLASCPLQAQPSAQQILRNVMDLHRGVTDYIADVGVATDIPGLNLPASRMTVYVKPPDKVHVESRSIAIIPRDALLLGNLRRHLAESSRVVLAGTNLGASPPVYCLKIMPKEDANRGRLLLWVVANIWTLTKSELWAGPNKLATLSWQYARINEQFWMPARLVCRLGSGALPQLSGGALTLPELDGGVVTITFSNYRINTGLTDEFFAARGSE